MLNLHEQKLVPKTILNSIISNAFKSALNMVDIVS